MRVWPLVEQVLGKPARAVAVVGAHRRDVALVIALLEEHERVTQLAHARDGRGAHRGIARQVQQGAVDAVLVERREQPVVDRPRTRRLDQDAVAAVAGDIANAGDHQVRHWVCEEPGVVVEHEHPERVHASDSQPARSRVRPVVERDHRLLDALARLLGHQMCASVDEVRHRLHRHVRALGNVAQCRPPARLSVWASHRVRRSDPRSVYPAWVAIGRHHRTLNTGPLLSRPSTEDLRRSAGLSR